MLDFWLRQNAGETPAPLDFLIFSHARKRESAVVHAM
jgi:hypothetical protein